MRAMYCTLTRGCLKMRHLGRKCTVAMYTRTQSTIIVHLDKRLPKDERKCTVAMYTHTINNTLTRGCLKMRHLGRKCTVAMYTYTINNNSAP